MSTPTGIATTEVSIRVDPGDGNDSWEETAHLAIVPRSGDTLCVWIQEDRGYGCREEYLDVKDVVLSTWAPERIEVWVSSDGHSDQDMARIFEAIRGNEQP